MGQGESEKIATVKIVSDETMDETLDEIAAALGYRIGQTVEIPIPGESEEVSWAGQETEEILDPQWDVKAPTADEIVAEIRRFADEYDNTVGFEADGAARMADHIETWLKGKR
jgi:hypothetical protein